MSVSEIYCVDHRNGYLASGDDAILQIVNVQYSTVHWFWVAIPDWHVFQNQFREMGSKFNSNSSRPLRLKSSAGTDLGLFIRLFSFL